MLPDTYARKAHIHIHVEYDFSYRCGVDSNFSVPSFIRYGTLKVFSEEVKMEMKEDCSMKNVHGHGHMDMWTCGRVNTWTCGHVDMWTYGRIDVRTCGHVDVWTCGHMDVWTCGCVDMWTCGHMGIYTYVHTDIIEKDNKSSYCARSCEPGTQCRPNECIFGSGKPRGVGILEWGGYMSQGREMGG